jgi:hypothetical protein
MGDASMSRILAIAIAAPLFSTAAVAVTSDAKSEPRLKTESALACILGIVPKGCERIFTANVKTALGRGGPFYFQAYGPYEGTFPYVRSTQYMGHSDQGDAVWDVKFKNMELGYIISQPDQDGKIHRVRTIPNGAVCLNASEPGDRCNPRFRPSGG